MDKLIKMDEHVSLLNEHSAPNLIASAIVVSLLMFGYATEALSVFVAYIVLGSLVIWRNVWRCFSSHNEVAE